MNPTDGDPLWVPVLTHYRSDEPGLLDEIRVLAQLGHLRPSVRQLLIAGTTGDGWGMSDKVFGGWLKLLSDPRLRSLSLRVMIGVLEETTEGVVNKARMIEAWIDAHPLAVEFCGLTVCPPVDASAMQGQILQHYRVLLAATRSPLAIYQLPQVTRCEIEPETFAELVAGTDQIRYLKDTSGTNSIVLSDLPAGDVVKLRGAEGDYWRHRLPRGGYDGWLLSSANAFPSALRAIANALNEGDFDSADRRSRRLTEVVEVLFAIAARTAIDNPFSLANRIGDHLCWTGPDWCARPGPLTRDGTLVGPEILREAVAALERFDMMPDRGYAAATRQGGSDRD